MAYLAFSCIQSISQAQGLNKSKQSTFSEQQQTVNARTGRIERVFVNLEAVYPNHEDTTQEFSFEELRAQHRGWLDVQWIAEKRPETTSNQAEDTYQGQTEEADIASAQIEELCEDNTSQTTLEVPSIKEGSRESRNSRPRKIRVLEVKAETQTSKCGGTTICVWPLTFI